MATNKYFQWYNSNNEQNLFEDLTVESIKNFGHDVVYLPRTGVNLNEMLGEYEVYQFNDACPVEIYVKNADSFEGEGELLSKFGLEIRDQMTLQMSIRSYKQFIQPTTGLPRPGEGDCIYIPFLNVVYQITHVNQSAQFYTLGRLMSYQLVCELFEYNNEQFDTGFDVVDALYPPFQNQSSNTYSLEQYDNGADNQAIQVNSDNVLDFTESDPFGVGDI